MNNVLNTAIRELNDILLPFYSGSAELGRTTNEGSFRLLVDKRLDIGACAVKGNELGVVITGQSESDVLHGVYNYLEAMGFKFTVTGVIPPEKPISALPVIDKEYKAHLLRRGIRQHINFPMDISGYPVWEAQEYIRNLARMKLNEIAFHLYHSCGWYHLNLPEVGDSFEGRTGRIKHLNFYYSEYHKLPEDKQIASRIRNKRVFCPPEIEAVYGTDDGKWHGYEFLQALVETAKEYGMNVIVSADTYGINLTGAFKSDTVKDDAFWMKCCVEALNQMSSLYGSADEFELISPENCPKPTEHWRDDCLHYLRLLLPNDSADVLDDLLTSVHNQIEANAPEHVKQHQKEQFHQILNSIYVARESLKQANRHPVIGKRLSGKKLTVGLYDGVWTYSKEAAYVLANAVPAEFNISWLPQHGAHMVQKSADNMSMTTETRERFRLYSWVEVDGYMYTLQFPLKSMLDNIEWATNPGNPHQSKGVLYNHWRNAENELSLLAVSKAAYEGIKADAFADVMVDVWGVDDRAAVQDVLSACEEVSNNVSSCGFCYFACWWEIDSDKSMSAVRGVNKEGESARCKIAEKAIECVDRAIALCTRSAGLKRLKFLRAVLLAGIAHYRCSSAMGDMAQYLAKIDKQHLTSEQRHEFQRLGEIALGFANQWLDIMSKNVMDRGVEGNIVSYHHVVVGYIKGFLGLYGEIEYEPLVEFEIPKGLQAPPPATDGWMLSQG